MKKDSGRKGNGKKDSGKKGTLKVRQYEKELAKLHVEVVKLQEWVKAKGAKVLTIEQSDKVLVDYGGSQIATSHNWVKPGDKDHGGKTTWREKLTAAGAEPASDRIIRTSALRRANRSHSRSAPRSIPLSFGDAAPVTASFPGGR